VAGSSEKKVYYAELDSNNVVTAVHLLDGMKVAGGGDDLSTGAETWVKEHLGTTNNVKQCFKYPNSNGTHTRKKYPVVGDTYQPTADLFYLTSSWPSWTLNTTTYDWEPPVAEPTVTTYLNNGEELSLLPFLWNESLQKWEAAGQDDRVLRWNGSSWDQISGPAPETVTYVDNGVTKEYKNLTWDNTDNRWECQKQDDTNMYWDNSNQTWSEI